MSVNRTRSPGYAKPGTDGARESCYYVIMKYTEEELKRWVKEKENKQKIIEGLCNDCESTETKFALFMAGSPGAGKTETATRLAEERAEVSFIHIDQDKIKSMIPGYTGEMAEKYHGAASIGVDIVFSHILKKGHNLILDSTFSNIEKAKSNIERTLKREYAVSIYFVYQDPENAWQFVEKRRESEGRVVPIESFVKQFIHSRITVNEVKKQFGKKVKLHLVLKTVDTEKGSIKEAFNFNVDSIDGYIEKVYTSEKELYDMVSKERQQETW